MAVIKILWNEAVLLKIRKLWPGSGENVEVVSEANNRTLTTIILDLLKL